MLGLLSWEGVPCVCPPPGQRVTDVVEGGPPQDTAGVKSFFIDHWPLPLMHGLRKRTNSFVIASNVTEKLNEKVGSRLVSVRDCVTSVWIP